MALHPGPSLVFTSTLTLELKTSVIVARSAGDLYLHREALELGAETHGKDSFLMCLQGRVGGTQLQHRESCYCRIVKLPELIM